MSTPTAASAIYHEIVKAHPGCTAHEAKALRKLRQAERSRNLTASWHMGRTLPKTSTTA